LRLRAIAIYAAYDAASPPWHAKAGHAVENGLP
jgi:hypothetical protein